MNELQQLREERRLLTDQMRAMLRNADGSKRTKPLTTEENIKWNELRTKADSIGTQIRQLEFLEEEEERLSQPNPESRTAGIGPDGMTPLGGQTVAPRGSQTNQRSYRSLFGGESLRLDNGGFRNFAEFLSVVHRGIPDERLQRRSSNEGTGSQGGFLVPTEFAAEVLDQALGSELVRPRARFFGMTGTEKKIPGFDSADHSSSISGWNAQWLAEGEAATESEGKFRSMTLKAKKLALFTSATNELVADAQSFESMLNGGLSRALSWYLDYSAINGSGTGQFLGFLHANNPALLVVAKEANQAKNTIKYENIVKMYARIHPSLMREAVWIVNQTCVPQLLTLSIAVGTGGSLVPVMTESNGQFRILGLPVVFTEKVPALGSQGDISLVAFSQYAIAIRQDILLERTNAVYWSSDKTAYKVTLRGDGQGTWDNVVTPKHGDTLSWCVTLGARV